VNSKEFLLQLSEYGNQPGPNPVKIYLPGLGTFDIESVTFQGSEDPDIEPVIVIRAAL
jgi:hypothetical protein